MRRHLDITLLLTLLVVVGLRPLIGETFSSARDPISASVSGLADPGLARTLALDVVALLAGGVALAASVGSSQRRARSCGLEWATLLFALAAALSCFVAGEKRPAINASLDWIAALVTAAALVRLLDRPWRIGLAIAVLTASGAVNVADCVDDRRAAGETRARYFAEREQIWASQGVPLDAPQVELFERRMLANEASGFFAHSNVAGGYLLLGLFTSLGLAAAAGRRRPEGMVIGAALAAAFGVGIVLTRGTGAIVAAGSGAALLALRVPLGAWWTRHRRGVFIGAWGAVVAATLAVVGHGLWHGSLPHPSLAFRWQYWTASAQMFRDHALTGVGAENFGHLYTQYKSIASSEEVKNPHNLFVQFATEYGTIGLAAALLMLVSAAWHATTPIGIDSTGTRSPRTSFSPAVFPKFALDFDDLRRLAWAGLACGAAIFIIRIPLLESQDSAFIIWMTGYGGLTWLAGGGAVLFAFAQGHAADGPPVASPRTASDAFTSSRAWLAAGCSVGLLAFLLQDTINFALFVPAARMTFLMLLAVAIALRTPDAPQIGPPARRSGTSKAGPADEPIPSAQVTRRTGAVALAALAFFSIAICIWQLTLVIPADRALRVARVLADGGPAAWADVDRAYIDAADADPYDATAPAELAQWMLRAAGRDPVRAADLTSAGLAAVAEAIARCPQSFNLRVRQAQLHVLCGRALGNATEFEFAVAAARYAVFLYPNHPRNFGVLGDCLREVATCESVAAAADAYAHALALDSQRPEWETIRRFNPRERQDLQSRHAEAQAFVAAHCGTQKGSGPFIDKNP